MTPAASPLTGAQFEIAEGDYLAVVTELGAGLRELRHRDRALITAYHADELPPGRPASSCCPGRTASMAAVTGWGAPNTSWT